jgi:D-alanyl-D-alanine carboxypeptidase
VIDLKSLDLTEDTWNIKIYTEQFVKIMNHTAKDIGMKDTNYVNPHGLDCSYRLEAYSILEDQATLTK